MIVPSSHSIRRALIALPLLLAGCGPSTSATVPDKPLGAADQEAMQREALKKFGRPGEGLNKSGPVSKTN